MERAKAIPLLLLLLLLLPILSPPFTVAEPPAFIRQSCSDGSYIAGSTYQRNLESVLSSFAADNQTTTGFYSLSLGEAPDRVNAIGLCRGDVGPLDCRGCIVNATGRILQDCPVQKEAFGYYRICQLQYSDRSIYGELDPNPPNFYLCNNDNASDPTQFNASLLSLLTRLRASAVGGSSVRKFARGMEWQGFVTIYGLMQCSPDLSPQLCDRCLSIATGRIPQCCGGKVGGRIINPDCNLRFETFPYLFHAAEAAAPAVSPPEGGRSRSKNSSRIIGVVASVVVLCFVVVFFVFFCCRRRLKKSRIPNHGTSRHDDATADELDGNQRWVQHNLEMFLRR